MVSVLDLGRLPKTDKGAILSDAVRILTQLRSESHRMKESVEDLQAKIKELKVRFGLVSIVYRNMSDRVRCLLNILVFLFPVQAEKNELRDEKQRLKAEKERMELHVRAMGAQPAGFLPPQPSSLSPALNVQGQATAASSKLMPFISYPGVGMWQMIPQATLDTSQDHVLRPPVA